MRSGEPTGRSSPTCWLQLRYRSRVLERRLGELPVFEQLVALALKTGGADRGGGGGWRRARSGGRVGRDGVPGALPAARVPVGTARRRRGPWAAPLFRAEPGRPASPLRAPLRPLAALVFAGQLLLDVAHGARLRSARGSRRLRGLCGKWMREVSVCIIRRNYRRRGGAGHRGAAPLSQGVSVRGEAGERRPLGRSREAPGPNSACLPRWLTPGPRTHKPLQCPGQWTKANPVFNSLNAEGLVT